MFSQSMECQCSYRTDSIRIPWEKYFGQQRQRRRVNENPSVKVFLNNAQTVRVISDTCSSIQGNCRGGSVVKDFVQSGPLLKRARNSCSHVVDN